MSCTMKTKSVLFNYDNNLEYSQSLFAKFILATSVCFNIVPASWPILINFLSVQVIIKAMCMQHLGFAPKKFACQEINHNRPVLR